MLKCLNNRINRQTKNPIPSRPVPFLPMPFQSYSLTGICFLCSKLGNIGNSNCLDGKYNTTPTIHNSNYSPFRIHLSLSLSPFIFFPIFHLFSFFLVILFLEQKYQCKFKCQNYFVLLLNRQHFVPLLNLFYI